MRKSTTLGAFGALCLLVVPAVVLAHHSLLNADASKLVDVAGAVTSIA